MRGSVDDRFVEPGFHRNCGTCGAGMRRIPIWAGLRSHWNGLLPTDAVHTDAACFARYMRNEATR